MDFILPIQVSLLNYVLAYLLYSKYLSCKQFCSSTKHTPTYEILNCENVCLKIHEMLHLGFKIRNCKSNGICLSRMSFFLLLLKAPFSDVYDVRLLGYLTLQTSRKDCRCSGGVLSGSYSARRSLQRLGSVVTNSARKHCLLRSLSLSS
jgi:hypothetical protein